MRRRPLRHFFIILVCWGLLPLNLTPMAMAQPNLCTEAAFAPLAGGYQALRAGNDEQARQEFNKVIKVDPHNPYALNNLAVLAERQGKLKEAMSFLLDAETYAAEYLYKADEICEAGGLCLAVVPSTQKSQASSIASIIHSNINLLRAKLAQTNTD